MSLFVLLASSAFAGIYGGNPTLVLKVDRSAGDLLEAGALFDKVRVAYCGGGYTDYEVDGYVNLVDTHARTIGGGDICGVRVYWASALTIEGASFVLEYDAPYTDVYVTSGPQPASLTPFDVLQGSITGPGPMLYVSFE